MTICALLENKDELEATCPKLMRIPRDDLHTWIYKCTLGNYVIVDEDEKLVYCEHCKEPVDIDRGNRIAELRKEK